MNLQLISKQFLVSKAWVNPDGSISREGWISTNTKDIEKDIMEPETFAGAPIEGYFERGSPVSSEHNTDDYPVGFMQKAALVRDGQPFEKLDNPNHPNVEFQYFPNSGTGWYGLVVIDDEKAIKAVQKGKVSAFSWIGGTKAWEAIPGGGRHFNVKGGIDPLLEATITAYPINPTAIMRIAKAHGLVEERPLTGWNPEAVANVIIRTHMKYRS